MLSENSKLDGDGLIGGEESVGCCGFLMKVLYFDVFRIMNFRWYWSFFS